MEPGGYRFTDYLKVGVPLTLVVLLAVALLLPIFWPLYPARRIPRRRPWAVAQQPASISDGGIIRILNGASL